MYKRRNFRRPRRDDDGWDRVAKAYDRSVGESGSDYHQNLIIPQALEMLKPKSGEKILDVGCGQGVLCRKLAELGIKVTGIDASEMLIRFARSRASRNINYIVTDAANLSQLPADYDAVTFILSLQNMDNLEKVISEVSRVIKISGRLLIVLNHPCFRIPRQSGWGFDDKRKLQYRRIDSYMTEMKVPIKMHPGKDPNLYTWSFHRPLVKYIKTLSMNNFLIKDLEEWVSHRKSQPGENAKAENRARDEIPLFLALEAIKL